MDYATMPAGPEIDALVAEKVMGLCAHKLMCPVVSALCHIWPSCPTTGEWYCPNCGFAQGNPFPAPPAGYSTNIAAAWEVVEKMAGETCGYHAEISLDESVSVSVGTVRVHGKREEIPLLICRAALMAVAKKESEQ